MHYPAKKVVLTMSTGKCLSIQDYRAELGAFSLLQAKLPGPGNYTIVAPTENFFIHSEPTVTTMMIKDHDQAFARQRMLVP
jgi:hypothetical protein